MGRHVAGKQLLLIIGFVLRSIDEEVIIRGIAFVIDIHRYL
jgi:hypothetical protein